MWIEQNPSLSEAIQEVNHKVIFTAINKRSFQEEVWQNLYLAVSGSTALIHAYGRGEAT